MAIEIERKFLVISDSWRADIVSATRYRQGYLGASETSSIRVRISDSSAYLNIKGLTIGPSRAEYEYPIPLADAREILDQLCQKPLIEKTRYLVAHAAHHWEIDVFEGENAGLTVAEIELESVDETFSHPQWLGREVTEDARYYNVSLVTYPYSQWKDRSPEDV